MNTSSQSFLRLSCLSLTVLATLAAAGATANAQTHPALATPPPASVDSSSEPYSATIATAVPLLATAASAGLLIVSDSDSVTTAGSVGLLLAPSLGHAYTGHWRGAVIGTVIRAAGVGMVAMSVSNGASALVDTGGQSIGGGSPELFVLGSLITLGGTVYSIMDAPYSAKRANKEHQQLTVTPAPIQGPDSSTGWGAVMQMTF